MDAFSITAFGILLVLMGLDLWWAFRSYAKQRWIRFALAVTLLVLMGFGSQAFPVVLFLILAPVFGWSFS